jgi:hypothetical protein
MPSGTTSTTETVTVTEAAPLLDTGSSSLGTEVTNEFVSRMLAKPGRPEARAPQPS